MKNNLRSFWHDESGQAMTEYALILAVVAVIVVAGMYTFRDELVNVFEKVRVSLSGTSS